MTFLSIAKFPDKIVQKCISTKDGEVARGTNSTTRKTYSNSSVIFSDFPKIIFLGFRAYFGLLTYPDQRENQKEAELSFLNNFMKHVSFVLSFLQER